MTSIAFVHGAGLGAWTSAPIAPALRTAGHDLHSITLTGFGDREHLAHPGVDLSLWVQDVVAHLEAEELEDVVLVGHSFAGAVVMGAAQRVPQRLRRLVLLDGVVLESGRSVFDSAGPEFTAALTALAEAHDGWRVPWFTAEQLDMFYGDHGLSGEHLAWLRSHVSPQPLGTYREALDLDETRVPRTYVRCLRTPGPCPVNDGQDGWEVVELDAGHWPQVTQPATTVAALAALAAR